MHAGLKPDAVGDVALEFGIDGDEQVNGASALAAPGAQAVGEVRAGRRNFKERGEFVELGGIVFERQGLGLGFEEEIEGVVDGHFDDEVHLDVEARQGLGENETGKVVGLGVLLPIGEGRTAGHLHAVGENPRAAVRRGPEADDVRAVADRSLVFVGRAVAESDVDGHGW